MYAAETKLAATPPYDVLTNGEGTKEENGRRATSWKIYYRLLVTTLLRYSDFPCKIIAQTIADTQTLRQRIEISFPIIYIAQLYFD